MNNYTKSYLVTANEIDTKYCLTPQGILLYLQDAIASYMATWHAAAFDISEEGLLWVVLDYSFEIDQINVPVWSTEVKVSLSVTEVTAMRTFFDFKMFDVNGNQFSSGYSSWTLINSQARSPYLNSLEYVLEKSCIDSKELTVKHSKIRFRGSDSLISEKEYVTQVTDVDFNGHVNNRTYISVAMGCFSSEFLLKNSVKNISIKYVKETYLGDKLMAKCSAIKDDNTFVIEIFNSLCEMVCTTQLCFCQKGTFKDVKILVPRN